MALFDIVMPKLGESIQEATITKWFVKVGDTIAEDDVLLELATDKVDSEIPSPVDGIVHEILFQVDALVPVGVVIARIKLDAGVELPNDNVVAADIHSTIGAGHSVSVKNDSDKFYSPVVRQIAAKHNLTAADLDQIKGTGLNGRVNKEDVMAYVESGQIKKSTTSSISAQVTTAPKAVAETPQIAKAMETSLPKAVETPKVAPAQAPAPVVTLGDDEVVEMDRMRKLIAEHMVMSVRTSPHVTSVVEADVTALVLWREKSKDAFVKKYGQKLTFMPIITEAVAKALRDFPYINSSVNGDKILLHKHVNIGIAVALPSGNLIVPVIKDVDRLSLAGISSSLNELAEKARINKLSPDDIQGGTFTITNFGSFKNIIGTPIINQPQVAILATGMIEKKPAVIETAQGDVIAIRHKMYLSLSYDHRVVDGMLGGNFLRRIAEYLEQHDMDRAV